MKIRALLFICLVAFSGINTFGLVENQISPDSIGKATLPPEIENPELLGIHKEPAHATLMPYASLQEALAANRHASSYCLSLNGKWKFNYVDWPQKRPAEFYKPSYDVSSWKEIPVPSNWQILGYGTPYYRNNGYTFKKDFPRVMTTPPQNFTAYQERNPVGSYRRDFIVPADWKERQVFLTFDGVDAGFFLWINGQKVGYSVNSRNAAEFDITKYLTPGKNIVAVEVYRYCSGSYLEDQDMWRLSGIFRNVTLWSAPRSHIRDFFIRTVLDVQYKDAVVEIEAKVKNYGKNVTSSRKLEALLYDGDKLMNTATASGEVPSLKPGEEVIVKLSFPVSNPVKWTAETPHLYTTVLHLKDARGIVETLSSRTGFRKIEIKGRLFMVNGTPIKLKGANRHENWPEVGHAITEEMMISDLELLKQGNCNHVRTCHYSDDPRWYELCDEWGIWLVGEANVESHGYDRRFDEEPRMKAAIIDRNVANTENFKNHPSVIIWSLGNECGGRGSNFIAAENAIKAIDPTRPVHYERFGIGKGNPADIDSRMYTHPTDVEKIAKDTSYTKPFYLCEYAHAMFNSMGAIGEYNDLFDKYPSLMGGAIWEWQDQGIWNRRDAAHPIIAYGGGFNEFPNDHYFIHKGVVFSDRTPKPHYPEMKKAYQWIKVSAGDLSQGIIKIRNLYQFINLDGFKGSWTLSENGTDISGGELNLPAAAPGSEISVKVPFKMKDVKPGAEYFLRISFKLASDEQWAKQGFEVASEQFKLPIGIPSVSPDPSAMQRLVMNQDSKNITVEGNGFKMSFDKTSGTFAQLEKEGINLLAADGGPRLHLWRAPHRNDDMWANTEWEKAGLRELKWETKEVQAEQLTPSTVQITARLEGQGKNGFSLSHTARYLIMGDGSMSVSNDFSSSNPKLVLGRIGVRMFLDKQLEKVNYFGRGPMENYADRKRGFDVGLYSSTVKEQLTPYEKPMECGNHEDVRWVRLTNSLGTGLKAAGDSTLLQFSVLPYSDEELDKPEYRVDLPLSKSNVLCIDYLTLGVGSRGCGPKPLDQYLVYAGPAKFTYTLNLLSGKTSGPSTQ